MRKRYDNWTLYVIKSQQGLIYTGITVNLDKRLAEHNSSKSHWTKRGTDWQLIYSESQLNICAARKREMYFKNTAGKEWLKRNNYL